MTHSLYHYQAFTLDRVRPILETRTIYFSNPKDFNDPWDCRPVYDTTRLRDPNVRKRFARFYVTSHQKHVGGVNRRKRRESEHKLRFDKGLLKALVDRAAGVEEDIFRRYRVYCLSRRADSVLMWAHYARNHTGICLEFDAGAMPFRAVLPVEYLDKYPPLDLTADTDAIRALTTKSSVWGYEQEVRLIAHEHSEKTPKGTTLRTNKNFYTFPTGALKAVILGCTMPASDRSAITSLAGDNGITVKNATKVRNRYELKIS